MGSATDPMWTSRCGKHCHQNKMVSSIQSTIVPWQRDKTWKLVEIWLAWFFFDPDEDICYRFW